MKLNTGYESLINQNTDGEPNEDCMQRVAIFRLVLFC